MAETEASQIRTGRCLCGSVTYKATLSGSLCNCYCMMCQRWSAGGFFAVSVSELEITKGEDELTVFRSSDRANRAFCKVCGSNIYYCAPKYGGKSLALGTLDDTTGLHIDMQYFIDRKPEGFSLAESTKTLTQAQIDAMTSGD